MTLPSPLHAIEKTINGNTSNEWMGLKPPKGRHWRSSLNELDRLEKNGLIEWSSSGNPRKIVYADDRNGKKIQDVWNFKDMQSPIYPTQKNCSMMEMVIKNSSNENSLIMDCFCGSATTLEVASRLNRRWIGVDNSIEAIRVAKNRLDKENIKYSSINTIEKNNSVNVANT